MHINILVGGMKGKDRFGVLCEDGRIVLIWSWRNRVWSYGLDSGGSG